MKKQNSSKSFPKMINTLGVQVNCIKIPIQGIIKQLCSKDFFQLSQIINPANSSELKIQGLYSIISSIDSITILHIFIYYCIKVTQSLDIEGIDEYYLKLLGNLYISNGFNIDISKYAQLVSKTTSIPLRKCIHILYFLVYGRLASNSYVNSVISHLAPKSQNKRQKLKIILSTKVINKKQKIQYSLMSNILEKQKSSQCDQLAKDLRQIFQTNLKSKDHQTKFKQWLSNEQKDNQDLQTSWDTDKGQKNITSRPEGKYYLNFFPNRVFNDERSAILQKITPNFRSNYRLMRKRKFDDSKIEKMLELTFNRTFPHDQKESGKQIQCSPGKQRNKILTHNIIEMNDKFKHTSSQLDKVRWLIAQQNQKKTQHQYVEKKNEVLSMREKQYFELIQKRQKKSQNSLEGDHKSLAIMQYEAENKIQNLLRKQAKNNNGSKKDSDLFNQKGMRKRKLVGGEGQDKNGNKVLYSLCQTQVCKYKNQYRKFMKLHLFQHQNDESR